MAPLNFVRWLKALLGLTIFSALLPASAASPHEYEFELLIAQSNGNVTVSWPLPAYYYTLVSKSELTPTDAWTGVATAASDFRDESMFPDALVTTNFSSYGFDFSLTPENPQSFYGLVAPRAIPIFQFAVFYQGLMEFSTAGPLTISGPVHGNADIYTGSSSSLTLRRTVTASGTISSPAWNGQGPAWSNTGSFSGNPPSVSPAAPLQVFPGYIVSNLHGIIETPSSGESIDSDTGKTRYYNAAQVQVIVSNLVVTAKIQAAGTNGLPGCDPASIVISTTITNAGNQFPFLTTTNTFTDQREGKLVKATQIDLGKYGTWLKTNDSILAKFPAGQGAYPTVLYVADCRTNSSATMSAIRIANGVVVPSNGGFGFTLATPNPLYVWGNYNTNSGTTNISAPLPASALVCDALTVLSANWKDSGSAGSLASRLASSADTINAAIIAGNVPSTGSSSTNFSGGVHNLPRLLEDWSTSTLKMNTSLVCLYQSMVATNLFKNAGAYFYAPTRKFDWNTNFATLDRIPPGCPMVGVPPPVYPP